MPTHKLFPPFVGHVKIPTTSRRSAVAALAIYAPIRRSSALLHRGAVLFLKVFGPRLLPGRSVDWEPPLARDEWAAMLGQLTADLGPIEEYGVYQRRQSARSGFSLLLLRAGSPVGFVRVNRLRHERFQLEHDALALIARASPREFHAPAPISVGSTGDWSFLATTVLLPGRHRAPRNPPIDRITLEIQSALAGMPRPEGTPQHWVPFHGDLTPWNLRDSGDGKLVLYDWEHVGWAPPGADEVLYVAAEAFLAGRTTPISMWPEARDYWYRRLSEATYKDPGAERYRAAIMKMIADTRT
jgi:hypothetical protein